MPLFSWTGNPWVDTGLAVMIARAKELKLPIKTINDLTPDIIERVCKSKINDSGKEYSWLTDINRRLNCYTMIFTKNGPLTQTMTNPEKTFSDLNKKIEHRRIQIVEARKELEAENEKLGNTTSEKDLKKIKDRIQKLEIKIENMNLDLNKNLAKQHKKMKKRTIDSTEDKGLSEYVTIIRGLVEDIRNSNYSLDEFCEATGLFKATSVLAINNKNTTREWFPLIGTMSDVQTLPSGSRSVRLSAVSLLAAQFMPMGMAMLGGKLVCFQTNDFAINDVPLFQSMVEEIYRETMQKAALADKIETWGKEGGYNSITFLLLGRMNDLMQRKSLDDLPEYICVNLWRFSNSGEVPYLELIEIPNEAIQFLWEAWRSQLRNEIEMYLKAEENVSKKEFQLLQCIQGKKEYYSFYPYNNRTPASIKLFDLYAQKVLGHSFEQLQIAKWIAYEIKKLIGGKELIKLKENLHKDYKRMKDILIQLTYANLSLEDYLILFPCTIHPLREDNTKRLISRRIIWFYLNHDSIEINKPNIGGDYTMFMHPKYPKVKSFANDFFEYYIGQKDKRQFEKRILTAFKQEQVKPYMVEDWFATLAETKDGYTNEEWDDLCRDENGNSDVWEVLFQLRLELTNLYRIRYKSNNQ